MKMFENLEFSSIPELYLWDSKDLQKKYCKTPWQMDNKHLQEFHLKDKL